MTTTAVREVFRLLSMRRKNDPSRVCLALLFVKQGPWAPLYHSGNRKNRRVATATTTIVRSSRVYLGSEGPATASR